MKLALALGMSVRRAMAEVDSAEFAAWRAFDRVEPFGDERADWRLANVASAAFNRDRDPNSDRCKPSDFMWDYQRGRPAPPQTPAEVEASIDEALGALVAPPAAPPEPDNP